MSFPNRNRPRLSERLRGKSSQDFIDEINSAFGSRSPRMLFDTPSWSTRANFPRGFPFDDDSEDDTGRIRRREFFRRDPFAERSGFHEPPCTEERNPKKRVVEDREEAAAPQPTVPHPLHQHGLRNTVPLAQGPKTERATRAMSAPPGDRTPRYTTSCEIPVMGTTNSTPKPQTQPNNVRVIPIQVEGRDEPLINSNIDTATHFAAEPSKFDGRLPRDFGSFRKQSARFQEQPQHQHHHHQPQQQQQQQQQPKQDAAADEVDCEPPTQAPVDPVPQALARINEIQLKVQELAKQVESVKITSRKDKQFVILDEMLTVQLLHLDNIDPEGHDNVRQARKDVIRAIQKCISILESKVPAEPMDVDKPNESSHAESEPKPDESATDMDTTTVVSVPEPASAPAPSPTPSTVSADAPAAHIPEQSDTIIENTKPAADPPAL